METPSWTQLFTHTHSHNHNCMKKEMSIEEENDSACAHAHIVFHSVIQNFSQSLFSPNALTTHTFRQLAVIDM